MFKIVLLQECYTDHMVYQHLKLSFTLIIVPLKLIQELVLIVCSFLLPSCIPTLSLYFYLKYHFMSFLVFVMD